MDILTRREFLKISALSACTLVISTGLSGCNNEAQSACCSSAVNTTVSFAHGVASGDPLSDKVIIWTRVTTNASSVVVNYEVATDADFTNIVHNGTASTNANQDFTVKIDVQNLSAATAYYYKFTSKGITSPVGKMKTLPVGSVSRVKMVAFSCANYPNGYFNAYMEASKIEDLDVSLHLGDYIYEYGMYLNDDFDAKKPAYATNNAKAIGRELPSDNNTECITLNDYRKRYALYRSDEGLQALHKACPMIAVWDDHEIANDTYKDGAQNHDSTEGDFSTRVEAALQAYFEWIPIRPANNKKEIYRTFTFGDLVSLNMLETRLLARTKQLSYADYFTQSGSFLSEQFKTDISSSSRTMLGTTQLQWLQKEFKDSSTKWQVLGQQVLMGRMTLPAELLTQISQLENVDDATKATLLGKINTTLNELASLKMKQLQGGTLSAQEQARLATTLPYNLDAWDGYYVERETIFATAKAYDKNLVVLAGDTHNSWANDLKDMSGNNIGVEFATTSVTSPGMEEYLSLTTTEQAMQLENAITLLIDDLKYANLNNRGFIEVIFTPSEAISNWHYISNYDSTTFAEDTARFKTLKTLAGNSNRTLV